MIKKLLSFVLFSSIVLANGVAIIDAENGTYLDLTSSEVQVNVESQVAVITSTQKFYNAFSGSRIVKYGFPLPGTANATALKWKIDGEWYEASFAPTPQDTTTPGPSGSVNADLKSYLGDTPIYFDIEQAVKADSFLTVEISYVQLLPYEFGIVDFIYSNDYSQIQSSSVDKQEMIFNLISPRTIESINMLSEHDSITTDNDGATASLHSITLNKAATLDYHIEYRLNQDELGLFGFSTLLPNEQISDSYGGFFLYIAEPDPSEAADVINKYFTIIIDRSGSMWGTKMTQAKNAASFIMENLNEGDWFSIVDFSSSASKFSTSHVEFNESNKNSALAYISDIEAAGGTNISGSFDLATLQFEQVSDSTANLIIFLTDGYATEGVTDDEQLISHINQAVQGVSTNISIFSFGIGNDVQKKVLTSISSDNNGFAEFLENDVLEERLTSFYLKIRNPVLLNTSMIFSSLVITETYPNPLPNLYKGQQMIVSGRYSEAVPVDVTLNGMAFGEDITYNYSLDLADSTIQQYQFLPKIWAKLKIEHLLIKYYLLDEGSFEAEAVKEQIIDVSLSYGVISPFTSFGDPTTDIEDISDPVKLVCQFELLGNYPNPFNPTTTIQFKVNTKLNQVVKIKIFDALGRLIKVLLIQVSNPGIYEIQWDGRMENGITVASGNYFYLVDFGNAIFAGKMQLLK